MNIVVSDDEKYLSFSFNSVTAVEGIALKRKANFPNRQAFIGGVEDDDPEAWQALVWLLRARAAAEKGEPVPRLSDTDFPWGTCRVELDEQEVARIDAAIKEARSAADEGRDPVPPEETGNPTGENLST
jgi:hypothetical protein